MWKQPCDGGTKQCWFTLFFAAGARQLFPCFDEPSAKATFSVRVARTAGWATLFNTPLLRSEPLAEGWVWDVFEETPVMSTYLLALAIQDFLPVPGAGNLTVWATQRLVAAGLADYAAEVGPQCIRATEQLYGVPYTLPKMDLVHVNNFGGAMENWGLVMFQSSYLLYDSALPDPDSDRKFDVLETVAHELAHQWYGNLVTCYWWDQVRYWNHCVSAAVMSDTSSSG